MFVLSGCIIHAMTVEQHIIESLKSTFRKKTELEKQTDSIWKEIIKNRKHKVLEGPNCTYITDRDELVKCVSVYLKVFNKDFDDDYNVKRLTESNLSVKDLSAHLIRLRRQTQFPAGY